MSPTSSEDSAPGKRLSLAITLTTNVAGALLAIVLVFTIGGEWTSEAIGWGAVAGLAGLVGLVLLYQGLADGPNRLVSPLSAVVAAIVPVVGGSFTR